MMAHVPGTEVRVDIGRLRRDIEELGAIGRTESGGVSRPSFSPADIEARRWLRDRIESAGLVYRRDGAGNQFGRLEGRGPVVMAGSHIDTVLNGGMFDGAAGVLAALECLRRIKEEGVPVTRPLEVASFTDEEGNLVGDFLGSRAFTGQLNESQLRFGRTASGSTLSEVLAGTGISVETILKAADERPPVEAYLELHIEQGSVLESEEKSIGVVEAIAGKRYRRCAFQGRAAHSGTTPFELRQDAFLGLADFALRATRHAAAAHYGSLATIGRVMLHPGAFSVVPGRADFTLDIRGASAAELRALDAELAALAAEAAAVRGLSFSSELVDATEPVRVPERLVGLLEETCRRLGHPWMRLTSGAGHDAQIIAACADAGMIFIPCLDGISHSPEERASWEDLEKGADLLLQALIRLAS